MQSGRISVRYAKALYNHAEGNNSLDAVYSGSYYVSQVLEQSKEFNSLLNNPVISIGEKEKIFEQIFKDKVNNSLFELIKLMVKKNREAYIYSSLLIYRKLYRQKQGIYRVLIESPTQITKDFEKKVIDFVQNRFSKKTELSVIVKPELIGGFILQVEDLLIDQSVFGQLNFYKKTLNPEQKVI